MSKVRVILVPGLGMGTGYGLRIRNLVSVQVRVSIKATSFKDVIGFLY